MWTLKSFRQMIPGNYFYEQREPIAHKFDATPSIEDLAYRVSQFRVANKISRASLSESFEDVVLYQCARLNNSPEWCFECQNFEAANHNHPFFRKDCPTCGKNVINQ
jgi:hypothetical protein